MTILRSGELGDQFTDQLLRDLIAKEATEGLGISCYLASLFSSGSVAVLGLGELISGQNNSEKSKPKVSRLVLAGNCLFSLSADDFFCL